MSVEPITFNWICNKFPKRQLNSHKGNYGRLLCITGSICTPGAAAMATQAALRCGTGLVTTATAYQNISAISAGCYESMYIPLNTNQGGFITLENNKEHLQNAIEKASAVLFGCGIGNTHEARKLLEFLCTETSCTLVLDADGLNAAAGSIDIIRKRRGRTILTPHPGEMAKLTNRSISNIQSDRQRALRELCDALPDTVVVLKGRETLVGINKSTTVGILKYRRTNTTGNPGMARGGSGDVLAGMTAAFAAQGINCYDAASAAVYIHGRAGDIAAKRFSETAMLPRNIIDCISDVFLEIEHYADRTDTPQE